MGWAKPEDSIEHMITAVDALEQMIDLYPHWPKIKRYKNRLEEWTSEFAANAYSRTHMENDDGVLSNELHKRLREAGFTHLPFDDTQPDPMYRGWSAKL